MIKVTTSGSTKNMDEFLKNAVKEDSVLNVLKNFGDAGVAALQAATPMDTGATALSWGYEIVKEKKGVSLYWTNTNASPGSNVRVAVLIQYGHGTGGGGYVQGIDYINPALRSIFESIANDAWKAVTAT